MRRVLLPLLVVTCALSSAQELVIPDVLIAGDRALAIHDPVLVLGQQVTNLTISDDGRYVVIVRETASIYPRLLGKPEPQPARIDLVVWDSKTGALKEMRLPHDILKNRVELVWLKNSRALVAEFVTIVPQFEHVSGSTMNWKRNIYYCDVVQGKLRRIFDPNPQLNYQAMLHTSPTTSAAVLIDTRFADASSFTSTVDLRVLTRDGTWTNTKTVPSEYTVSGTTGWSPDGRTFYVEALKRSESRGRFDIKTVLYYNIVSGDLTEVQGPADLYKDKNEPKEIVLDWKGVGDSDQRGEKTFSYQWWIKAPNDPKSTPQLIAEHADFALLSPKEDYVAFSFKGALFVRRIQELTIEQFEEFLLNEARKEAMYRAKQVMLGLLMYATDYDNKISTDLNFPDDLLPYLKNRETPDGFVYTFEGGNLLEIGNPSGTIVGYIDTKYGKAIAYLDGHIGWEEKK